MGTIKGPSALKEQISSLEQDITRSLVAALHSLGGAVISSQLTDGLNFSGTAYKEIYLNAGMEVIFLAGKHHKETLETLFNENKVLHWDLIYLLEAPEGITG